MKSAERVKAINLLQQKVELYEQLLKANSLGKEDMIKYKNALEELAKLNRIESSFMDVMEFAKTYFAGSGPADLLQDHTPSPPFHFTIASAIRKAALNEWGGKYAFAAPRSHSKSTIVSNIFLCWCVCFCEDINRYYWVLIGDKQGTAQSQLAVVKNAFESNEKLKADFGDLTTRTWNALEIVTANGVKVQAAGSGEALRGLRHLSHRPNLILDDAEGADNVSTSEQIAKHMQWFDMTVQNLGDPRRSLYIIVGTVLHYQSLLSTLIKRPEWKSKVYAALVNYPKNMNLWDEWQRIYHSRNEGNDPGEASEIAGEKARKFYEDNKIAMDEEAEVLWPERMPLYDIMRQRATNPYAFSTELQNNPVDSETQVFKKYHTYEVTEIDINELGIIGGVDPSLKETKRSDPSAILTVGKSKTGIYYVLDVDCRKRSPDNIIENLMTKADTFHYRWVTVETIQFQQFFADELRKRSARAGMYLNIKEFKSTIKKEIRITALEPLITNGYIRILPTQLSLIEQLTYFPKVKNDDILDCLAQIIEQDRKRSGRGVIGRL